MVDDMDKVLRAFGGIVRSGWAVVAAAATIVGAGDRLMGWEVDYLPYWGWWVIAILALSVHAIRQQMIIDQQSDDLADKHPSDVPVEDVLRRILRREDFNQASYNDVEAALETIRHYAQRTGSALTLCGERTAATYAAFGTKPLIEIGREYWLHHKIVFRGEHFPDGVPTLVPQTWVIATEAMDPLTKAEVTYEKLKANSSQVNRLWPRLKKRVRIAPPWRIEVR